MILLLVLMLKHHSVYSIATLAERSVALLQAAILLCRLDCSRMFALEWWRE